MPGTAFERGRTKSQRSGPERPGQFFGEDRPIRSTAPGHFQTGDVYDNRIYRRSAFDFINAPYSLRIKSVRRQAINRFGGQRHHFSCLQ